MQITANEASCHRKEPNLSPVVDPSYRKGDLLYPQSFAGCHDAEGGQPPGSHPLPFLAGYQPSVSSPSAGHPSDLPELS